MDGIVFILISLLAVAIYIGIFHFGNSENSNKYKPKMNYYFSKISTIINSLSETEIKVIALVVGTFLGLCTAYSYRQNIYYSHAGRDEVTRVFYKTTDFDTNYDHTLGFAVLIISAGIIYLLLKRIKVIKKGI